MLVSKMTDRTDARTWLHEPPDWNETADSLTLVAPPGTDYWRVTHYGFIHDNGPFQYQERAGNFAAKVKIAGTYRELYHHAGLMIRIDETQWIKAGVEFLNSKQTVGAVVTREFSDWSVVTLANSPAFLWLRLQRFSDTVQVSYSLNDQDWSMIRLAYFPPHVTVRIGMFAGAPGKEPFEVTFQHFSIGPLDSPPAED
jgi:regulation of enolase protein 1 (concanavalin A-like superfamily)